MHRRAKLEGILRRRRTARFARAEGVGLPEREARTPKGLQGAERRASGCAHVFALELKCVGEIGGTRPRCKRETERDA